MLHAAVKFGFAGVFGAIVGAVVLVGSNLWTYSRLTHEADVGSISFQALGPELYQVVFVDASSGDRRRFQLAGDEWQLDTRIIKWTSWVNLLGRDTLYQLDRISGRYVDARRALAQPPTLVDLRGSQWLDLWELARDYPKALFVVDAQYGSSVFLPMQDGASYRISMSNTGVLARRTDEQGKQ